MMYHLRVLSIEHNNQESVVPYRDLKVANKVLTQLVMDKIDNEACIIKAFKHRDLIRGYTVHYEDKHIITFTLSQESE